MAVLFLVAAGHSSADGVLPSPAAVAGDGSSASEYWDLTIETEDGHRILSRFVITNQGPGTQSGIAVGHIVAPDGRTLKFRNGRLQKRWNLSGDGLRIDIGSSRLTLRDGRSQLRITKSDVDLNLSFALNALRTVPGEVTGPDYRIDLLALGADVRGTIRLEGMESALEVRGHATLSHTISPRKETDTALRRIEVMAKSPDSSIYFLDLLRADGSESHWLAQLTSGCDASEDVTSSTCTPQLRSTSDFDLIRESGDKNQKSSGKRKSYWIPNTLSFTGNTATGQIRLAARFLRHDPLEDLPGPIRFIARFSAAPRREWFASTLQVTIPPKSESTFIQFQGKGVGAISFLNPVTHSRVR